MGTRALMDEALLVRKRFGGGMRQSGIIAAAALYALEHHLARLPEDHARAAAFAKRVDGVAGARVVPPDTNIVMLDLPPGRDTAEVAAAARKEGVLLNTWTATRIRTVFHLDVSDADVTRAADVVCRILEGKAP